jgi:mono/diheme cytochrome c family protein
MRARLALSLAAGALGAATAARSADREVLRRGEYLVGRVGMCQDCHSPRDGTGRFIRAQWLI